MVARRVARNPEKLHLRPPKLRVAVARDTQRATHEVMLRELHVHLPCCVHASGAWKPWTYVYQAER